MRKINVGVLFICSVLFLLPFFWISPGELEMGGDSNRLFLYDPGSYLQVNTLYSVEPQGLGSVQTNQNLLPFLFLLTGIDRVLHSPYLLMMLLNSLKLVGSFLFIYLIVQEILSHTYGKTKSFPKAMAAVLAGLFYTLSPAVGENMRSALLTHNQVFLNPMIFYLVLRLFVTGRFQYIWIALFVTLIFSPNFSLIAPPPPFAFYPLALLFIGLYTFFCLKKPLPWKHLFLGVIFFLAIHAFHFLPAIAHIFDPSSTYYMRALDATSGRNEALDYFNSTVGLGSVSKSLFLSYTGTSMHWASFVGVLSILLGFFFTKKVPKALMLIVLFFSVTLFLVSANITQLGVAIYRTFFYIPGFSMFRVFYGQWQWVFTFFYALLVGFCSYLFFVRLKKRILYVVSTIFIICLVINSAPFVSGKILRTVHPESKNMTSIIRVNPDYEKTLSFIRLLPDDGKLFNFPFNDFFYQLVPGVNNGAYIGPSFTSYLTGKRTFSAYQTIYPFPEVFLKLAKEKNYSAIKVLFGLLNVRYIYYVKDPKAFVEYYPTWPYSLFLNAVPNQEALTELVDALSVEKVFEKGDYVVYRTDRNTYLPHFYVPQSLQFYENTGDRYGKDASFFLDSKDTDPRVGYIDAETCSQFFSDIDCRLEYTNFRDELPKISFQKINPIKYLVSVRGAKKPFVLVFSDQFHKDWKIFTAKSRHEQNKVQETYFEGEIQEFVHENTFLNYRTFETVGKNSVDEAKHFMINGYANAWHINPEDIAEGEDFEIIVEMTQQRLVYYGLGISIVAIGISVVLGLILFKKQWYHT